VLIWGLGIQIDPPHHALRHGDFSSAQMSVALVPATPTNGPLEGPLKTFVHTDPFQYWIIDEPGGEYLAPPTAQTFLESAPQRPYRGSEAFATDDHVDPFQ